MIQVLTRAIHKIQQCFIMMDPTIVEDEYTLLLRKRIHLGDLDKIR